VEGPDVVVRVLRKKRERGIKSEILVKGRNRDRPSCKGKVRSCGHAKVLRGRGVEQGGGEGETKKKGGKLNKKKIGVKETPQQLNRISQ